MNIGELIRDAHETAKSKGWWEEKECPCLPADQYSEANPTCVVCKGTGRIIPRTFGDQIALMHSELSEALEEFRNGEPFDVIYYEDEGVRFNPASNLKPEGIAAELADVLIR